MTNSSGENDEIGVFFFFCGEDDEIGVFFFFCGEDDVLCFFCRHSRRRR